MPTRDGELQFQRVSRAVHSVKNQALSASNR
jgi:hypothetical protein